MPEISKPKHSEDKEKTKWYFGFLF